MPANRSLPTGQPHRAGHALRLVLLTLLALLALSLFFSTGLAKASAATPAQGTPPGKGWVRAAHLVPGIGSVRIDLIPATGGSSTGIQMSPDARYGSVTSYQKVAPGAYTVTVRDSDSAAGSTPMLSRAFTVKAGKAMTLAVLGTVQAPRLAALDDDLTPPAAGTASVRVLPAAAGVPEVTVQAVGGPTITSNAVLGQATGYAAVPAGTWHLKLTADNGTTASDTVRVASGSVYTLVVLDGTGGSVHVQGIVDAAGAMAAPKGGAATGGGGMAAQLDGYTSDASQPTSGPAIASTVLLLLLGTGFGARTWRRRSAVRSGR